MDDRSLYGRSYFTDRHYGLDSKRETQYNLDYRKIVSRVPDGGSILDVGCGLGVFLNRFLQSNWKRYGYEVSDFAKNECVENGITMLESLSTVEEDYFDVVVYRGTLQHISNPIDSLYESSRALKHGGLLAILATPNTNSLGYRRWKTLPALDKDRNWVEFSDIMLLNILRRLGYRSIVIDYPYGHPYSSPVIDLIRFISGKPTAFPGNMMEMFAWKD